MIRGQNQRLSMILVPPADVGLAPGRWAGQALLADVDSPLQYPSANQMTSGDDLVPFALVRGRNGKVLSDFPYALTCLAHLTVDSATF
jgi:hypothetical protein